MGASSHKVSFPADILERGFWLYVWRVQTPRGELLYVGRTGDSSSPNANPPIIRMAQNLWYNRKNCTLRINLEKAGFTPEDCTNFEFVSYGPVYLEIDKPEGAEKEALMTQHKPIRNKTAAMEKALAEALSGAGYNVINTVRSRMTFDEEVWTEVKAAFSEHFPKLVSPE